MVRRLTQSVCSGSAQACSGLLRLAQACSGLLRLAQACSGSAPAAHPRLRLKQQLLTSAD